MVPLQATIRTKRSILTFKHTIIFSFNFILLFTISYVGSVPYKTINVNDFNVDRGETSELQLVQVVFRHGDRTPDHEEMLLYPANPHANETFEPYGLKALTNAGKEKEYKIGLYLRDKYADFLSDLYIPNEIYVRTTDFDRTKMSALACLAGLYPPEPEQQWHRRLMWQPIPYHTVAYDDDDMLYYYNCPRFLEARLDHLYSPEFQKFLAPQAYLFEKISGYTGRNLTTPEDVFYIDNLFQSMQNYDLDIPKWGQELMSEIKKMTITEYKLQFATDELRVIAAGQLLNKMVEDALAKINGTIQPSNRKMFLYSGHENNVAAILACSGVFEAHQPPYGSTFILELHKMLPSGKYAFRIIYSKHITRKPKILTIPNCGEFCEVNKFIELTKNHRVKFFKDICALKHG